MAGTGTYILTTSKTIQDGDNIAVMSIKCISGTVTVLGTVVCSLGSSVAMPLAINDAVTISSASTQRLSGITIDASSGVARVIIQAG